MLGSGTEAGTRMQGCFEVVEQFPLRVYFMWPFEVAMPGGRYLATTFPLKCGALCRNLLGRMEINVSFGGQTDRREEAWV